MQYIGIGAGIVGLVVAAAISFSPMMLLLIFAVVVLIVSMFGMLWNRGGRNTSHPQLEDQIASSVMSNAGIPDDWMIDILLCNMDSNAQKSQHVVSANKAVENTGERVIIFDEE